MKVTAIVQDTNATPSPPSGTVQFTDGGVGGTFSSPSCTLSSSGSAAAGCTVSYSPSVGSLSTVVTITAVYGGDAAHAGSAGSLGLQVVYSTAVSISPGSGTIITGTKANFTATVSDVGATNVVSPVSPKGTVTWTDAGASGSFSATSCTLVASSPGSSSCTVVYTPPTVSSTAVSVTIAAAYGGDQAHAASAGGASLSVVPAQVPVTVSFQVFGGQTGALSPTFTYTLHNQTYSVVMTAAPITLQVDTGTDWFVPNQLQGSTAGDAWNLVGGQNGAAYYSFSAPGGGTSLAFVYYHQYLVTLGYNVVGGTSGASVPPFVRYTSYGVTKDTGAPGQIWIDVGTAYSYPPELPGSLGQDRWLAQNVSGTVSGPGNLSPTYYHQYNLTVSYRVVNPPTGQVTAPLLFGQSMGRQFNESLATLGSQRVWLDAGSQYSFTDPLTGNSVARWSAGADSSGAVSSSNIVVTYYEQYSINASYSVVGGPPPLQLVKGSQVPVVASIVGLSGGLNATVPLTGEKQTVWLDGGTPFSIAQVLFSAPTERWVASQAVVGTVATNLTVSQEYFHQFLVNASISQKTGTPPSTPSLAYTSLGSAQQQPLAAAYSTVWVDAGSSVSVPSGSAQVRWYSQGGVSPVVSQANETVVFYQQFAMAVSLNVVGGSQATQGVLEGIQAQAPVNVTLGAQLQTVWLDSQSQYLFPKVLLELPTERWVASSDVTGSVIAAGSISQTYYHQFALNLSYASVPAPVPAPPSVNYTAFGTQALVPLAANGSVVWADSGTSFSVPSFESKGASMRWSTTSATGSVTQPLQETFAYWQQLPLTYSFVSAGGNPPTPPTLTGFSDGAQVSVPLQNQSQLWLDIGSHWKVSVAAPSGDRWIIAAPTNGTITEPLTTAFDYTHQVYVSLTADPAMGGSVTKSGWYNATSPLTIVAIPNPSWALADWAGLGQGSYAGENGSASIFPAGPINQTAVFQPGLTVTASSGGSVRVTTGASPFTVGASKSAESFVTAGQPVTLEAQPSPLYQFVGWAGAANPGDNPLTINATSPQTIQAVFKLNYVEVAGIPAAFVGSGFALFFAREPLVGLARSWLDNFRTKKRVDED